MNIHLNELPAARRRLAKLIAKYLSEPTVPHGKDGLLVSW